MAPSAYSSRLAGEPAWVVDYVLVHELAHLSVRHHNAAFWKLVHRYPLAERALGYLMARGLDADMLGAAHPGGGSGTEPRHLDALGAAASRTGRGLGEERRRRPGRPAQRRRPQVARANRSRPRPPAPSCSYRPRPLRARRRQLRSARDGPTGRTARRGRRLPAAPPHGTSARLDREPVLGWCSGHWAWWSPGRSPSCIGALGVPVSLLSETKETSLALRAGVPGATGAGLAGLPVTDRRVVLVSVDEGVKRGTLGAADGGSIAAAARMALARGSPWSWCWRRPEPTSWRAWRPWTAGAGRPGRSRSAPGWSPS